MRVAQYAAHPSPNSAPRIDLIERGKRVRRTRGLHVVDRELKPCELRGRRERNDTLHCGARTDPIAAKGQRQPHEQFLVYWSKRVTALRYCLRERVGGGKATDLIELHTREQTRGGEARVFGKGAPEGRDRVLVLLALDVAHAREKISICVVRWWLAEGVAPPRIQRRRDGRPEPIVERRQSFRRVGQEGLGTNDRPNDSASSSIDNLRAKHGGVTFGS